jgi:hypothetical protein
MCFDRSARNVTSTLQLAHAGANTLSLRPAPENSGGRNPVTNHARIVVMNITVSISASYGRVESGGHFRGSGVPDTPAGAEWRSKTGISARYGPGFGHI